MFVCRSSERAEPVTFLILFLAHLTSYPTATTNVIADPKAMQLRRDFGDSASDGTREKRRTVGQTAKYLGVRDGRCKMVQVRW